MSLPLSLSLSIYIYSILIISLVLILISIIIIIIKITTYIWWPYAETSRFGRVARAWGSRVILHARHPTRANRSKSVARQTAPLVDRPRLRSPPKQGPDYIYIYIYIYIWYKRIYIYIYRERERDIIYVIILYVYICYRPHLGRALNGRELAGTTWSLNFGKCSNTQYSTMITCPNPWRLQFWKKMFKSGQVTAPWFKILVSNGRWRIAPPACTYTSNVTGLLESR